MTSHDAAKLSPVWGAIRHPSPGRLLIARHRNSDDYGPSYFANVYHLDDVHSGISPVLFRSQAWSDRNTDYFPNRFSVNATDWVPLLVEQGELIGFYERIQRLEPLQMDLNEYHASASRAEEREVIVRLHDDVVTRMVGKPFVVDRKCLIFGCRTGLGNERSTVISIETPVKNVHTVATSRLVDARSCP
jgi:hypothetical protein